MIAKTMDNAALEGAFDMIAENIDKVGEEKRALFLAKLSLTLANMVGQEARVREAVEACVLDL